MEGRKDWAVQLTWGVLTFAVGLLVVVTLAATTPIGGWLGDAWHVLWTVPPPAYPPSPQVPAPYL